MAGETGRTVKSYSAYATFEHQGLSMNQSLGQFVLGPMPLGNRAKMGRAMGKYDWRGRVYLHPPSDIRVCSDGRSKPLKTHVEAFILHNSNYWKMECEQLNEHITSDSACDLNFP